MKELPLVTVVVPVRNEVEDIEASLAAVAGQTYPLERIEVVVVDGASDDGTPNVAGRALRAVPFHSARVLSNDRGTTPSSLNLGLKEAAGDLICRVDARSLIPEHYVATCVEHLQNPSVAVIGGAQVARARDSAGPVERGIARALRNPYGMGFSRYRRGADSGPSDTVYLGAFRREDLLAEGGWDERFLTNQDFELNRRMAGRGAVWFDADLEVGYRPRRTLRDLAAQYRRFGRWKAVGWLEACLLLVPRQVLLLLLPAAAASVGVPCLRRSAATTGAVVALGVGAVDAASGERGSAAERAISSLAMTTVWAAWWVGVIEQATRWCLGQRLLDPGLGSRDEYSSKTFSAGQLKLRRTTGA